MFESLCTKSLSLWARSLFATTWHHKSFYRFLCSQKSHVPFDCLSNVCVNFAIKSKVNKTICAIRDHCLFRMLMNIANLVLFLELSLLDKNQSKRSMCLFIDRKRANLLCNHESNPSKHRASFLVHSRICSTHTRTN